MDGLSTAASVIAVVQAIQIIVSLCSQYLASAKHAIYDIQRLQGELTRLGLIFEGAKMLLEGPKGTRLGTTKRLRSMLLPCTAQLEDLAAKLEERLDPMKPGTIAGKLHLRMKWPFESEDIDRITLNLCKFRDALSVCLNIDQTALILQSFEQVEANEGVKILNWISSVPHGKHHNTIKEARTPGTCEWILQDRRCQDWEHCNMSMLLWLQGSPGTGKTFLTSKIVDHINLATRNSPNREGLAFFYCNRNEDDQRRPVAALRSWIRQLSTATGSTEQIPTKLRGMYHQAMKEASDLSLQICKEYLLELVHLHSRTSLILDALDECDSNSRGQLIEVIEFLLTHSRNSLKVFVSSRPDGDIRERFQSRPYIEIQATNNQDDIGRFVKREITSHRRWRNMSPSLKEHILQTIIGNSNGMFQWASLQVKQLLELLTEAAIMDRLGRLPSDLKTTYDEMYGNIRARNRHDRVLADRAFMLVMCSFKSLNSVELLSSIRLDSDPLVLHMFERVDEDLLLDICNNLLVLDKQEKVWRFSHISVMEYLEEHHYDLRQAHCYAAIVCLRLLTGGYEESRIDGPKEIFHPKHPFQFYCRNFWHSHTRAQGGEQPNLQVVALLELFLGSPKTSSIHYQQWFFEVKNDLKRGLYHTFSRSLLIEISPPSVSLFAVLRLSLIGFLGEWLDSAEIPLSLTNILNNDLLTVAALSGSTTTCKILLGRGFSINPQDEPYTSFHSYPPSATASIRIGHSKEIAEQKGLRSTRLGHYGHCLIAAASEGYLNVVKYLLAQGADVNLEAGYYGSALVAAAAHGRIDTVELLLANGADVNRQIKHRRSALVAAAESGFIGIVMLLLDNGAIVQQRSPYYGSVLEAAAMCGSDDIIRVLVDHDANTNFSNDHCGDALITAAIAGKTKAMEFLIERIRAISMHTCAHYCGIALIAAAGEGSVESIRLLIKHGADVNLRLRTTSYSSSCGSALAEAAHRGRIRAIKLLIQQGSDVNLQLTAGYYGNTLAAAAASGKTSIVKFLVRQGADVDIQPYTGKFNALEAAALFGDTRMVRFLLKHGIGPNGPHRTEMISEALEAAVYGTNVKSVKFLIKQGVDLKQTGWEGSGNDLLDHVRSLRKKQAIKTARPNASGDPSLKCG